MRLAACHDNIAALQNLFEKASFPAHIECLLADHWAIPDRQVLHRRPKALRVLLREEPLDVEQLRRFNQASGVSDCRLAVVNDRHQPGLEIDHKEERSCRINRQHALFSFQLRDTVIYAGMHKIRGDRSEYPDAATVKNK